MSRITKTLHSVCMMDRGKAAESTSSAAALAGGAGEWPGGRYDYVLADLQHDANNLLPESDQTRANLIRLGRSMFVAGGAVAAASDSDGSLPAAYTYLGQFINHDISREITTTAPEMLHGAALAPMQLQAARDSLRNARRSPLALEVVYRDPARRNGDELELGRVFSSNHPLPPQRRPEGKDDFNDIPRKPKSEDPAEDRAALIGDPRNDENAIISQLHVAFLRAHNRVVTGGKTFDQARTILRQHYQDIVLHDFLKRIVDPVRVDALLSGESRLYPAGAPAGVVPLEFSAAAFRFGHSLVRASYDYNVNFNHEAAIGRAPLISLFNQTAFSGNLGLYLFAPSLNERWIIEWPRILSDAVCEKAHKIDTRLVEPLAELRQATGKKEPGNLALLAVRNLLRGYLLRMPTGQAVAKSLGEHALTADDLRAVAASVTQTGPETQLQVLNDSGFLERTPLWYYVLAEAGADGGNRLGPVGGTIVAEVLVWLVRNAEDSILGVPGWKPSLPHASGEHFRLQDLLEFAGVYR